MTSCHWRTGSSTLRLTLYPSCTRPTSRCPGPTPCDRSGPHRDPEQRRPATVLPLLQETALCSCSGITGRCELTGLSQIIPLFHIGPNSHVQHTAELQDWTGPTLLGEDIRLFIIPEGEYGTASDAGCGDVCISSKYKPVDRDTGLC